jgi:tRNA dimethylallyltransferase
MRKLMLIGPTASGKSALARELLERFGDLEPVSMDAYSIYRGMEIGSDAPPLPERVRLNYHLVGHKDPTEDYSLGEYLKDLGLVLADLDRRGKGPLFVGGTALWARAVANGMEPPPSYPSVRAWLETKIFDEESAQVAYHLLCRLDPDSAERIDPRNIRRIIRALEVSLGSGGKHSVSGPMLSATVSHRVPMLGIRVSREVLKRRIADRIDQQLRSGWVEEVRALSKMSLSRTAANAIGYREIACYIRGEIDLGVATELIYKRTWRFAKRQLAWFEKDPRIVWVEDHQEAFVLAGQLLARTDGW